MAAVCIIQKPIIPTELYRQVRDSQLIGMSGYSREVQILFIKMDVKHMVYFVQPYHGNDSYSNNVSSVLKILTSMNFFQGLPVFAIGVGLSTFDKASVSFMINFLMIMSLKQLPMIEVLCLLFHLIVFDRVSITFGERVYVIFI